MSEMVERVARAMKERAASVKWTAQDDLLGGYREIARAAIEAHEAALAEAGYVIVPPSPAPKVTRVPHRGVVNDGEGRQMTATTRLRARPQTDRLRVIGSRLCLPTPGGSRYLFRSERRFPGSSARWAAGSGGLPAVSIVCSRQPARVQPRDHSLNQIVNPSSVAHVGNIRDGFISNVGQPAIALKYFVRELEHDLHR